MVKGTSCILKYLFFFFFFIFFFFFFLIFFFFFFFGDNIKSSYFVEGIFESSADDEFSIL